MIWTEEEMLTLREVYPKKGKAYCAALPGRTEHQIRSKASRMQIKARGVSEAWNEKNAAHSVRMKGRKRPEQSLVMKNLHSSGKLKKTPDQIAEGTEMLRVYRLSNPHPRGFSGHKHNEESKRIISKKSKLAWGDMTDEKIQERTKKMLTARFANGKWAPERVKSSWKASWREVGGKRKFFRSRWEANYARYLEFLKVRGDIIEWQHESKVFWFEGIKRGCVSYLPDFEVTMNDGSIEFHEVKGWMDDRSKTKIKRMAKYHPKTKLVVIEKKSYESIKKSLGAIIPEWE